MKKIVIISLFLLPAFIGWAQPGLNLEMEKNFGDKKVEEAKAIIQLENGGYALAGYTRSYGGGRNDFWVVKTDQQGLITWQRTAGLVEDEEAADLCETKDGSIVVIGNTQSIGKGKKDILIVKFDALGNKVWEYPYGDKGDDWGTKIRCLPGGELILIANSAGANGIDGKLIKLGADGKVIWEKTYGSKGNDYFYGLELFKDGSIAVCGTTTSDKGNETNFWIMKLDATGNLVWEQKPGTKVMNEQFTDLSISYEGEIFVIGQTLKSDGGTISLNNYTLAKFDAAGTQKWVRNYEQSIDFAANSILATPDNKAVLITRSLKKETQLVKIADFGEIEWTKNLTSSDKDLVYNISLSNTGGYLLAGSVESKGFGGKDFWMMNFKDLYASLAFNLQKKKERVIVLNGVSTLLIDSAYSPFKAISFDYKVDGLNVYAEVSKAVNQRLAQWEIQGKFESNEEYYGRLTLLNARAEDLKQTQESLQKLAPEKIVLYGWKLSEEYNRDDQTYTITSPNKFPMKLFVPLERAKTGELDANWSSYTIGNPKYAFLGQDPVLYSADIIVNGQVYPYEAVKTAPYANQLMLSVNKYDENALQMALFYSEAVKYVQGGMDNWLKQGEFETPEAFRQRLTPEKKAEQEKFLSAEAFNLYAPNYIKIKFPTIGTYDAVNQRFPILFPGSVETYVNVPAANAPMFKEKWDTYEFVDFKYGYLNNKYVVVSAGIVTDNLNTNADGSKIVTHMLSSLSHPLHGNSIQHAIHLADMDFNRLDNYTFKSIFPDRKRTANPPNLIITNVVFADTDKNNRLDAEENGKITFTVLNNGKGTSYNTKLQIFETSGLRGLQFEQEIALGDIEPDNNKSVTISISAVREIKTAQAKFAFQVSEAGGHKPEPTNYTLQTFEYVPPKLEIVAYEFATDAGGTIQKGQPVHLKVTLKNTGTGTAKGIRKTITNPVGVTEYNTGEIASMLASNESTTLHYVFMPTMRFAENEIGITVSFSENSGNSDVKTLTVSMSQELLPYTSYDLVSDIDSDIPKVDESLIKRNRFAIIFGNEDYKTFQTGLTDEANVEFAAGDAIMFKKYATNLLGIPENNIRFKVNAKKTEMLQMISEVLALAKALSGQQAEIYFYYAGHGFPHEVTKEPYIMPVDVSGANVSMGIKSADLYNQLVGGENVGKVSVFMDACFSGGGREQGLLAARAVKVKPVENPLISGNLVVFSASQGDQTALPYADKNHGIFTYFLLKKLKESGGKLTYDEWSAYVKENVQETSVRVNKKPQDPKVITSSTVIETWQDWTTH